MIALHASKYQFDFLAHNGEQDCVWASGTEFQLMLLMHQTLHASNVCSARHVAHSMTCQHASCDVKDRKEKEKKENLCC